MAQSSEAGEAVMLGIRCELGVISAAQHRDPNIEIVCVHMLSLISFPAAGLDIDLHVEQPLEGAAAGDPLNSDKFDLHRHSADVGYPSDRNLIGGRSVISLSGDIGDAFRADLCSAASSDLAMH
jgi:hypothetical protein